MMYDVFNKIVDYDNNVKTIDKVHYEVHNGSHYTISKSTTLIANSTYYISLVTSANVSPHLTFTFDCADVSLLQFYEDATAASTWAANTVYNNNRTSTNTASMSVRMNVPSTDVTSTGTLLESIGVPAGYVKAQVGVSGESRNEWVLAKSKTYLARITSASTNSINATFIWYED